MFEQTFVDGGKTKKTWTIFASFIGQIIFVGILIILPMIFFEQLPGAQLLTSLVAPPPPPPPPPPPAAAPPVKIVKVIPRQFDAGRLMAPKSIPRDIAVIREEELPPPSSVGVSGSIPSASSAGGILGGILGGIPTAAPPPPPPPKPAAPVRGDGAHSHPELGALHRGLRLVTTSHATTAVTHRAHLRRPLRRRVARRLGRVGGGRPLLGLRTHLSSSGVG